MSDTATIETVETPAPGTPAAFAAAGDVRAFMALREAQSRGEQAAVAAPVAEPVEKPTDGETPALDGEQPPAGEQPTETPTPQTDEEKQAAEASEAARTLNEAKKRKKDRVGELQEEIDTHTWRKHRAREEADAEEQRLAALRAERAKLEAQPPAKPEPKAFDPGPEPKVEDFAQYEDYVKAAAKREARIEAHEAAAAERKAWDDAREAERQQAQTAQQQAEHDRVLAAHTAKIAEFSKTHPDYQDVMEAAMHNPQFQMPPTMFGYMLRDANDSAALAYELAKLAPKDFRAIADLPPPRMLAALGRLEAQIEARTSSHPTGPTPVRTPVSPAARPVSPVRSSAPVTAIPSQELAQTDGLAFMRERDAAERRKKYGR